VEAALGQFEQQLMQDNEEAAARSAMQPINEGIGKQNEALRLCST